MRIPCHVDPDKKLGVFAGAHWPTDIPTGRSSSQILHIDVLSRSSDKDQYLERAGLHRHMHWCQADMVIQ